MWSVQVYLFFLSAKKIWDLNSVEHYTSTRVSVKEAMRFMVVDHSRIFFLNFPKILGINLLLLSVKYLMLFNHFYLNFRRYDNTANILQLYFKVLWQSLRKETFRIIMFEVSLYYELQKNTRLLIKLDKL